MSDHCATPWGIGLELGRLSLDLSGCARDGEAVDCGIAFLAEHLPEVRCHGLYLFDRDFTPARQQVWPEDYPHYFDQVIEHAIDDGAMAHVLQHGRYVMADIVGHPALILRAIGSRHGDHGLYLGIADDLTTAAGVHLDGIVTPTLALIAQALDNLHLRQEILAHNDALQDAVDQRTQELTHALQASQATERSKSVFLATMSHEIRTPLNGILGALELLNGSFTDTAQQELVNTAHSSAEHLMVLLNDILDLAKIESGRTYSGSEALSIHTLLQQVLTAQQPTAKKKQLQLVLRCSLSAQQYHLGDPVHIRQIIFNLLGNAIKFTPAGTVSITAEEGQTGIVIIVEDTGIGIDTEALATIFDPFQQAHEHIHRDHGGTGLGLAISHRLAAIMGGTLAVASEIGKGSRFTLFLPLPPARQQRPMDRQSPPSIAQRDPRLHGLQVLVAEDNAVNRIIIQRMLERLGCQTTLCDNGSQAWELLTSNPPQILLTDLEMPVCDGYQLAAQVREREYQHQLQHLPIIAISAHSFSEHKQHADHVGIDGYVDKPLTLQNLSNALATALDHHTSA